MAKKRDKDKEARKRRLREALFSDLAAARRVYAAGMAALAEPGDADADAEPGDREPGVRTPVVRLVWDGATLAVPPELGTPRPDQLLGSPLDQLIEVAGRSCYDSLRAARSRNSLDYHQHIREVRHYSVHEHPTLTFRVRTRGPVRDLLGALVNRVGVWCEYEPGAVIPYGPRVANTGNPTAARLPECEALRLTLNLRAVREWAQVRAPWAALGSECDCRNGRVLGALVARAAALAAPLACGDLPGRPEFALPDAADPLFGLPAHPDEADHVCRWAGSAMPACIAVDAVTPASDDEVWASCHIAGVSRGFSHELVRHADWSAISQRSTRYVDESDSDWVPHPLVARRPSLLELFDLLADLGRAAYDHTAGDVEAELAGDAATRPSARKQARGAARGLLGNALATRLVYSASLRQWKWILAQRGCEAADGEIRVLACRAYELLAGRWPERFGGWGTAPASDGVGYVLLAPPVPQPTFWTPAQAA